jgi:hypothetical protein
MLLFAAVAGMLGAFQWIAGGAAATRWVPTPTSRFQIILSNPPSKSQLRGNFNVLEMDGFETPATTVAAVHALGKKAVCYIDVGTWESWRPDAKKFPKSDLGRPDAGWPGERWLDIRRTGVLLPIMKARFARCVAKGFDAVDPDNVNGVENPTGFALTVADQLAYDRAIASLAHADGLAVALKSYPDEAKALQPSFDFVVDEQCVQYKECDALSPFVTAKKAVFDIEYTSSLAFCSSLPKGVFGLAKRLSLDGWVRWCG